MPPTSLNPFPHNAPHPPTAFGRGSLPLPKGEGIYTRAVLSHNPAPQLPVRTQARDRTVAEPVHYLAPKPLKA